MTVICLPQLMLLPHLMACKGEKGSCLMNAVATFTTEMEVAWYDFSATIPEKHLSDPVFFYYDMGL